jgi:hypothetical protein
MKYRRVARHAVGWGGGENRREAQQTNRVAPSPSPSLPSPWSLWLSDIDLFRKEFVAAFDVGGLVDAAYLDALRRQQTLVSKTVGRGGLSHERDSPVCDLWLVEVGRNRLWGLRSLPSE